MPRTSDLSAQKEQIEQAALIVFGEQGYSGTTVAEIAVRAGVSPAVLYRFYTGKRQLFETLHRPDLDFPDQQEQQRRETIMRAALQVFSQKGYAAATMDDIAGAAGLSKAGVYFYFSSKDNLFSAALENPAGFAAVNPLLDEYLSAQDADLEEGLVRVAAAYLSLFQNEEFVQLLRVILSEGTRSPEIASLFKEKIVRRGSENVAKYLSKFCNLPPQVLVKKVQMLFGTLFSWGLLNNLLARENEHQDFDLDRAARESVHQFLFGISESTRKQELQEKI